MNNWGANHGAISYGHIGADLITLAAMLRIPVYMHNVPEEKVFRPSAWNPSAQRTLRARISAHAPITVRCTEFHKGSHDKTDKFSRIGHGRGKRTRHARHV